MLSSFFLNYLKPYMKKCVYFYGFHVNTDSTRALAQILEPFGYSVIRSRVLESDGVRTPYNYGYCIVL